METRKAPRAKFNADRMVADMALRGWNNTELARHAEVSPMTVTRFLRGEAQTAKTAERLARALGYPIRRYFAGVGAAA